jgi:hypothetical protein
VQHHRIGSGLSRAETTPPERGHLPAQEQPVHLLADTAAGGVRLTAAALPMRRTQAIGTHPINNRSMTTTPSNSFSDSYSNSFTITITETLTRTTTYRCTGPHIDELERDQTRMQWVEANWREASDEPDNPPFEVVHSKQVEIVEYDPDQD